MSATLQPGTGRSRTLIFVNHSDVYELLTVVKHQSKLRKPLHKHAYVGRRHEPDSRKLRVHAERPVWAIALVLSDAARICTFERGPPNDNIDRLSENTHEIEAQKMDAPDKNPAGSYLSGIMIFRPRLHTLAFCVSQKRDLKHNAEQHECADRRRNGGERWSKEHHGYRCCQTPELDEQRAHH
jgi:hypothetical protein